MEKKTRESTSRKSSIPEELMYDMFSWLPVKSLTRFKCVSKFYNSLVSDPSFVAIHHSHSISRPDKTKFLALSRNQERVYIIDLQMEHKKASAIRIEELEGIEYPEFDYVKGLFCFWSTRVQPPVIYNPTTRKIRFLPCLNFSRNGSHYYYSLGFDPNKKNYKILMIARSLCSSTRYWVFTLGTSESWREVKSAPYPLYTSYVGGVCIDGAIYFFGSDDDGSYIVAFSVRTENFKLISVWGSTYRPADRFYNFLELEGKLAVVDCSEANHGEMVLRILQSFETEQWVKHTIDFPQTNLRTYFTSCFCSSTVDGEIMFITNSSLRTNKIFFYDPKKKNWREIEIMELEEKVEISGMRCHVDSLLCASISSFEID